MKNNKYKKFIVIFDFISLSFGILGVLFGLLSLFALVEFWSKDIDVRRTDSLIFTILTLCFDTTSVVSAFVSFRLGKIIFNSLKLEEKDPIKAKLVHHEKTSYKFDKWSFIIGICGMLFGLTSLLTITPLESDEISKIATGVSIVLDFLSALMIVFALSEYRKYNDVKSIAIYVKRAIRAEERRKKKQAQN